MPNRGSARPRAPTAKLKRLPREGALGQLGVNLIEKIVTEMGSRWTPSGENEVGIDGYVELFEPSSRNATGLHLSVQSKAVTQFKCNADKITFTCKRADIEYWLSTAPRVILVVSQPSSGEAYWLSVRDYFGAPAHRGETVAVFDRKAQRLTAGSYDALLEVARPTDRTPTRSPVPVREELFSNLIPLREFPPTIFVAAATFPGYEAARACLREREDTYPSRAWALREEMLFSFVDPSEGPLARLVHDGTVEEHDASLWATSEDELKRRLFVELLNGGLIDDMGSLGVRFHSDDRVFAFKGSHERAPRMFTLQNVRRQSTLAVVTRYLSRGKNGREYPFLRHSAFYGRFRKLDGVWLLEVTPTYRYTSDGFEKYRFHQDQLAGIKRIEGNRAVLSQVLLWNEVLRGRAGLFGNGNRLLRFGSGLTFTLPHGVPDSDWIPTMVRDDVPAEAQLEIPDLLTEAVS